MAELTAFEKIILENDKRKESNLKKKVAADKLQSDKDNKLLVELNDKLADQSKLNEQQIEVLKGQQAEITQRKIDKEEDAKINKDTVKSRLDIRKDNLAQFNKTLTDEGKKAESVQAYRDEDLKIKNEEFELQKKGADNRQARREIEAEQKKMNDDAKKSGSVKEDIKERTNSLAAAFSKSTIGKGILSIGKSIGGFIGGLASTATGGAMMFLKGIISASVLGLIITFLKSDMFKEFLSEENLKKLADFFIDLKGYFKTAFDFIADPENTSSIAYALGVAAFAKFGGFSLIGGTLMALGGLFSLRGIFGKKALTEVTDNIAKTKKGGGLGKFTKFLKLGGLIGLGVVAFDGIKAAQASYMKGNPFGKIVADSVGGMVESLTFGIVDAAKISEFFSPDKKKQILEKQAEIKKLEATEGDVISRKHGTSGIVKHFDKAELIAKEKKALMELIKVNDQELKDKKEFLKNKKDDEEFNKKRALFLFKKQKELGVKFSDRGNIIGGRSFDIVKKERAALKEFDMANSSKLKREVIEEKKKQDLKAIKLENDNLDKIKMKELNELKNPQMQKGSGLARQTLIGLNDFGGAGATINNTTVVNQKGGDSKVENKTIMSKPATNLSFHEVYIGSY